MSECPNSESWQRFLAGTVPDRSLFESHLVRCRTCRQQVIQIHDQAEEIVGSESVPEATKAVVKSFPSHSTSRTAGRRLYLPLAAAATIILAVTLTVFMTRDSQQQPKPTDLRQSTGAITEIILNSPANQAELTQGSIEFRWSEIAPGAKYDFTLTDEKGDILSQQKLQANKLTIDTFTLRLNPSRTYYWSIKALLPTGVSKESNISSFTLR